MQVSVLVDVVSLCWGRLTITNPSPFPLMKSPEMDFNNRSKELLLTQGKYKVSTHLQHSTQYRSLVRY